MFVKAVSLPGPRVLWGTEGLMNAFIDSSGKFTLYGATNLGDTGGGVLSNGTTSHVAFVNDGPGQSFKVFADGAEVFSASTGSYPVMGHDQIAQVGFGGQWRKRMADRHVSRDRRGVPARRGDLRQQFRAADHAVQRQRDGRDRAVPSQRQSHGCGMTAARGGA